MSLVRSWRAAVLAASGAVLLVPAGLVLAVALAATLTGFGHIGRIGQLFEGPGIPPPAGLSAATGGRPPGLGNPADALPAVPLPSHPRNTPVRFPAAAAPTTPTRRRQATRRPASRTPARTTPRPRRPARPRQPVTTPAPAPATPPAPAPQRPKGVVRRLGESVANTVRPLPLVGPVAADAVQTVLDLVDPPPGGVLGLGG